MTAPANTKILPFADRIELVRQVINQRVNKLQSSNPYELRARLWCKWICREVLL